MFAKKTQSSKNDFAWDYCDWWGKNSKAVMLQKMNPVRLSYILQQIKLFFPVDQLNKLSMIDVGCGGGLLTESLASLGSKVVGVDISSQCIEVARQHAALSGLHIDYLCASPREALDMCGKFDVVLSMETVEHVENFAGFVADCAALLKEKGLIFFSTVNRTVKSFVLGIAISEYLAHLVPVGTHSWGMFRKPHELHRELRNNCIAVIDIKGMRFDPWQSKWLLEKNLGVNYILSAVKR